MADYLWSIRQDVRGHWWVYRPDQRVLGSHVSRSTAIDEVCRALGPSGGTYELKEFGQAAYVRSTTTPNPSAKPTPTRPTLGPVTSGPPTTRSTDPLAGGDVWKRVEPAATEGAKALDAGLGRKAPDDPLAPIKNVKISAVVPGSIRGTTAFKEVNQSIAGGSAGLAVVALVFGGGTAVAVTSGIATVVSTETTVGTYLTFGHAFLLTLALSLSAAVFAYLVQEGQMKSYSALGLWMVSTLAISTVTQALGFPGPTAADLVDAAGNHSPIQQAVLVVLAFLSFYSVVPFLGGCITGGIAGRLVSRLIHPPAPDSKTPR